MFKNSHILVVGGAGFVGSNLCTRLLKELPLSITVVDNLLSSDIDNIPVSDNLKFIYGSICDDRILEQIGRNFDIVFHLSTYHGNQSSIFDPLADHQNNLLPTLKLCEHLKGVPQLKSFVYASAGCTIAEKTFDVASASKEDGAVPLYLDSPYQISKIVGEFYGNYYWKTYKLPFIKARFQNVYGPREVLGAGQWRGTPATVWRNVIPTFIWKALNKEVLPLEKEGIATRDFIYIDDIVEGLLACADKGISGEVYNLGSGQETSIKDLSYLINELTKNSSGIQAVSPRSWDRSGKRFADIQKSSHQISFEAQVDLREGIRETIQWTQENFERIKNSIEKHHYFITRFLKEI